MQSGVCFGMATNLSTGERLVFLVEANVSRQQKRFVFQAETNDLVLSKLGTGSSGKRKHMFSSKN
jgi:NAD(P)H-dependent flavin oxidoreductase YrpB (nitropropane dioxygenase family)